jgi:aminopeptidase N
LALEVDLDVPRKAIRATARLEVRRVDPSADELALDAVGFDVSHVRVDSRPVPWRYDGQTLHLVWPRKKKRGTVTVRYAATPRRGLYFLTPDEHYPDRPLQVWSQCQEEDARHFVPCHDSPLQKMSTEVTVRVPSGWYALSNGTLVAEHRPRKGAWTYHWKMSRPHSSYLLTLVAGEFAEVFDEVKIAGKTIPLPVLVPKGREKDAARTFQRTGEMVAYFSHVTKSPNH